MAQPGDVLSRTRSRSSDHNERLEPRILKAAERDDVDELRRVIDAAQSKNQLSDNFLRIALMRSSEKGKVNATRYLLERGAPPNGAPGNRLSPLLLAIERHDTPLEKGDAPKGDNASHIVQMRNNIPIIQLLLEHGADTETRDKKGRTALMNALLKNEVQKKEKEKERGELKKDQSHADTEKREPQRNDRSKHERPKSEGQQSGRASEQQRAERDMSPQEKAEFDRHVQQLKERQKSERQTNHQLLLHTLISNGADLEAADNKGRTVLMTAAWMNQWHILNMLIAKGADVNAKDHRKRNVLHNLAADQVCAWGDSVIDLLLEKNVDIDGDEVGEKGQDGLGRTPLIWACATGKLPLAEKLLSRKNGPKARIDAVEMRSKTALHIAAARDRDDIVELLLREKASVDATSDGGWTPLHNACENGRDKIVQILLNKGADINAKLLNGMSPLHLAAQEGRVDAIKRLLDCKGIKRSARDNFGSTPFLRAAQKKQKEIVSLLAPFNNIKAMSEDALQACNEFKATIVDFGDFRNLNRVTKRSVFELLYGRDPVNDRKPAIDILPKKGDAAKFRWVHLPANNMAWVEALLTKVFIEEDALDIEGFKALERSFSHQHRGARSHSHFMRPLCQTCPRAQHAPKAEKQCSTNDQGPPVIVINGRAESSGSPRPPARSSTSDTGEWLKTSPKHSGKETKKEYQKDKGKKPQVKGNKSPKGAETPTKEQQKPVYHLDHKRPSSPGSPGSPARKDPPPVARGNIFIFMPYLHFETTRRRQEMQEAIKRAEDLKCKKFPHPGKAKTSDEMLIRAHLNTSTVSLHVRRTLDQSFYHNIDTSSRDKDQVVYRYQIRDKDIPEDETDPKIVMVDQLWMWILGKDLLVTAFPQRWQQPKNDPLNVLDNIIEDINSKTGSPIESLYDLATTITSRCSGVFDRHRMGNEEYQFLDMFESSIGSATDMETVLFDEFNDASKKASAWLQHHRRPNRFSRFAEHSAMGREEKKEAKIKMREKREEKFQSDEFMRGPLFVDNLLDIGKEANLLAETKDIRDELNMIAKVLEDQKHVLPDLETAVCDIYKGEQRSQQDVKKRFKEQLKAIEIHIKDLERMDRQAERIATSVIDMLDLKQKHANALEARFARDQAAGTARQSQTIMVFTIVTIIFLPLSFIAAFFAIDIREFPHGDNGPSLPLAYVSKYTFGIGFAISIPAVFIALNLDEISHMTTEFRRWMNKRNQRRQVAKGFGAGDGAGDGDEDTIDMLRAASMAKSARKSYENQYLNGDLNGGLNGRRSIGARPTTAGTDRREKATGFRFRASQDVERGIL